MCAMCNQQLQNGLFDLLWNLLDGKHPGTYRESRGARVWDGDDDKVRGVCIWRLEQKKINQKINKTLKSLQSTEQDTAASSRCLAQKDALVLVSDPPKNSAGTNTHTPRGITSVSVLCVHEHILVLWLMIERLLAGGRTLPAGDF